MQSKLPIRETEEAYSQTPTCRRRFAGTNRGVAIVVVLLRSPRYSFLVVLPEAMVYKIAQKPIGMIDVWGTADRIKYNGLIRLNWAEPAETRNIYLSKEVTWSPVRPRHRVGLTPMWTGPMARTKRGGPVCLSLSRGNSTP